MAVVYEQQGNKEKSYYYLKRQASLADSLADINKQAVKVSSEFILEDKETGFKQTSSYYLLIIICAVVLLSIIVFLLVLLSKRLKKTVAIHKEKQDFLYEKLSILKESTSVIKVDDKALKHVIELAASNDPSFLIKFQELQPVFIQKLMERAPTLVTSDLLICAQLHLGFYTKKIARYTNASVRAIEGKKYRIRKKLNIPAAEDINVWMMQL